MLEDSLGYTAGKVLSSHEGIKLGLSGGKVLGTILGNVDWSIRDLLMLTVCRLRGIMPSMLTSYTGSPWRLSLLPLRQAWNGWEYTSWSGVDVWRCRVTLNEWRCRVKLWSRLPYFILKVDIIVEIFAFCGNIYISWILSTFCGNIHISWILSTFS